MPDPTPVRTLTETLSEERETTLREALEENPRALEALGTEKSKALYQANSFPLYLLLQSDSIMCFSVFLTRLQETVATGIVARENNLERDFPWLSDFLDYEKTRADLEPRLAKIREEGRELFGISTSEYDPPPDEESLKAYEQRLVLIAMSSRVLALFDLFRETFWTAEPDPEPDPE